jgi:glycine betaine/proline transport system substrate-binding protein
MSRKRRHVRLRRVLGLALGLAVSGLAAGCATGSSGEFADEASAGGSDSLVLLEQPWVDLQVQNQVTEQLLERLGYSVEIESVSVELGAKSMQSGQIDAYLGNWWPSQEPTFGQMIQHGDVRVLSTLLTGTQYSPAVPGDTARRLGISSLADLDAHANAFGRKIYGIEPGTPGNATVQKMITENRYGLGDWKLVESSTPAMLTQVQRAVKAGRPIAFLGWSPHWMTVQFDPVFLADPQNVWPGAGEIRTLARAGYAQEAPEITTFLSHLRFTKAEASRFYYAHDKRGQSLEQVASSWIRENPERVRSFLTGVESAEGKPATSVILGK